ncbi:ABC transporter ATP-binding protein, partial [Mycoplasmopsis alligatoris]
MKKNKDKMTFWTLAKEITHFAKVKKSIYLFAFFASLLLSIFVYLSSWIIGYIFDHFFSKQNFNPNVFNYQLYFMLIVFLASS